MLQATVIVITIPLKIPFYVFWHYMNICVWSLLFYGYAVKMERCSLFVYFIVNILLPLVQWKHSTLCCTQWLEITQKNPKIPRNLAFHRSLLVIDLSHRCYNWSKLIGTPIGPVHPLKPKRNHIFSSSFFFKAKTSYCKIRILRNWCTALKIKLSSVIICCVSCAHMAPLPQFSGVACWYWNVNG